MIKRERHKTNIIPEIEHDAKEAARKESDNSVLNIEDISCDGILDTDLEII